MVFNQPDFAAISSVIVAGLLLVLFPCYTVFVVTL